MSRKANQDPVLFSYLKRYQDDPTSRVFAPLAEAYRKAGLIDDAIEIAREGMLLHPGFVGGRVALARALFDKHQYEDVLELLNAVIEDVPDNLVAQRLLAESYLMTGKVANSLGCYKMLLYFNPNDAEVNKIVSELENQAYRKGSLVVQSDYQILDAGSALSDTPENRKAVWIRKIERLQRVLQKLEGYRAALETR
jgi:tetratricopeptide (TPR) repeat protein